MISPIVSNNYTCWWILNILLYESFGLVILHTCNQHRDGLMLKNLWPNYYFSILGRVSKLVVAKNFLQLHMLVDFNFLFI